jgi:hypothetical protein
MVVKGHVLEGAFRGVTLEGAFRRVTMLGQRSSHLDEMTLCDDTTSNLF